MDHIIDRVLEKWQEETEDLIFTSGKLVIDDDPYPMADIGWNHLIYIRGPNPERKAYANNLFFCQGDYQQLLKICQYRSSSCDDQFAIFKTFGLFWMQNEPDDFFSSLFSSHPNMVNYLSKTYFGLQEDEPNKQIIKILFIDDNYDSWWDFIDHICDNQNTEADLLFENFKNELKNYTIRVITNQLQYIDKYGESFENLHSALFTHPDYGSWQFDYFEEVNTPTNKIL